MTNKPLALVTGAFLASKKASTITGEAIYVDGGRPGMNYTC